MLAADAFLMQVPFADSTLQAWLASATSQSSLDHADPVLCIDVLKVSPPHGDAERFSTPHAPLYRGIP